MSYYETYYACENGEKMSKSVGNTVKRKLSDG